MTNHLSIKIRGEYADLPEDFSIDVEDVNPLFNDYESYTFDAELPIESNKHIFKDIDNIRSDKRLIDMENDTMQIIAEGIPFRTGKLRTNEDESIDKTVSVSMISSTKTIEDMVSGLNCQDIPVKDKIQIGEIVGNVLSEIDYT